LNIPFFWPQVREFMLHKVLMLRRPKTNIQIIQQTSLLKNKKFLHFLKRHGPDLFKEVGQDRMEAFSGRY
jgi:hypothetical protein